MLPSHRDSVSLLVGGWFYASRSLVFGSGVSLIALAAWQQDRVWLDLACYLIPLWIGLTILVLVAGPRAQCAVCAGPLFNTSDNVKHSSARRFLGSYRLWTALQVIFLVSYRCHHCGTTVCCHHSPKLEKSLPPSTAPGGPGIVLQAKIGALRRNPPRR